MTLSQSYHKGENCLSHLETRVTLRCVKDIAPLYLTCYHAGGSEGGIL